MTYRQDKLNLYMLKTYNAKYVRFEDHIEVIRYGELKTHLSGEEHENKRITGQITEPERKQQLTEQAFRIKRKVKYYLQANQFTLFWTLTFNDQKVNAKNYVYSRKRLQAWLKYQREKFGKFAYLFIPELHPESGRIHFHGVTGGLDPPLTVARYPKSGRRIVKNGVQIFNANNWQNGFSTVSAIQDKNKAASYIAKYVTKELMLLPTAYHQPRYFVSRGLKRPTVSYRKISEEDLAMFKPKFVVGHVSSDTKHFESDISIYRIDISADGELLQNAPVETAWKLRNSERGTNMDADK